MNLFFQAMLTREVGLFIHSQLESGSAFVTTGAPGSVTHIHPPFVSDVCDISPCNSTTDMSSKIMTRLAVLWLPALSIAVIISEYGPGDGIVIDICNARIYTFFVEEIGLVALLYSCTYQCYSTAKYCLKSDEQTLR